MPSTSPDDGAVALSGRVFLSYSRSDTPWAERLRARLAEAGVASFLDRYGLPAGQPWQPQLEAEIGGSSAVVVLCGPGGLGNWQQREIAIALDRQANAKTPFPVIPVLLPGNEEPPVGSFLALNTWIDLRQSPDDPGGWTALLAGLRGRARDGVEAVTAAINPYRGLLAFREQDAGLFFGREAEVATLLARATTRSAHNVVGVIGRSGSGKSSVVFAGLIPALRRARARDGAPVWDILHLTPGAEPLQSLARAVDPPPGDGGAIAAAAQANAGAARLRSGDVGLAQVLRDRLAQGEERGSDRVLLVVDQWEELYTGTADPAEVRRFIDIVLGAAREAPMTLVLTVRSDFYDRLIEHAGLKAALDAALVPIGPMRRPQIIAAIEKPAKAVGFEVQPQLVRLMCHELGLAAGEEGSDDALYDAARLPLLEFALERTWRAARAAGRRSLMAQDYVDIGGLEGALEATADEQYAKLSPAGQQAARRLLLSLVSPGEGRADLRVRAAVAEDPATREALAAFTSREARLLSTDALPGRPGAYAEVTHEALIRHWRRLQGWIAENRATLRRRDQMRAAFERWIENGRDDAYLLPRGIELEVGRRLLAEHGDVPIAEIAPYIERSIAADDARRMAERRRWRNSVLALGAIAFAASAAAIAAGTFYAEAQRETAAAREAHHLAIDQTRRALTSLAAEFQRQGDAATALLLALRAVPARGEERAEDRVLEDRTAAAIWRSLVQLRETAVREAHPGGVNGLAVSEDGALLASGGEDGRVRLWRIEEGGPAASPEAVLQGHAAEVTAIALSADGRSVASGSADQTIRIWPTSGGPARLVLLGHTAAVNDLDFHPDGVRLASAGGDGTVRLWRLDGSAPPTILFRHRGDAWSVAFSSDGRRLVSAGDDGRVRIDPLDGSGEALVLEGHDGRVASAEFDPAGERVVSAGWDGSVRVWPLDGRAPPLVLQGHSGWVNMASFTPDGGRVFSVGEDGTLRLWPLDAPEEPVVLRGHQGEVNIAAASPDGALLVSGGDDGTLRAWRLRDEALEPRVDRGHEAAVQAVAFGAGGALLASGGADGRIVLRDETGAPRRLGPTLPPVTSLAFSRDGERLASGDAEGLIRLWRPGDPAGGHLPLHGHSGPVLGLAFGLEGGLLVSAGADGSVRVWDAAGGGRLLAEGSSVVQHAVAVSREGRIAVGGEDGAVRIWDQHAGGAPRVLTGFAPPVRSLDFSPDGQRLAVAGGRGRIVLLGVAEDGPRLELRGHVGEVASVLFGPLGLRVISAGHDGTLRVWRADGSGAPWVQRAHDGIVNAVAVSPDGARIASAGRDRTVRLWTIGRSVEELIARACAVLPRDLDDSQGAAFGLARDAAWPCAEAARGLWPNAAASTGR